MIEKKVKYADLMLQQKISLCERILLDLGFNLNDLSFTFHFKSPESLSDKELNDALQTMIDFEHYEDASKIRDILNARKNKKTE